MSLEVHIKKELSSFPLEVDLEAGTETLGLLGASGCGKSMTLRCIAGVETPDEGRIVVNGRVFFDSAAGVNLTPQERKTALLFQNYQLFPNMTVAENVAAGMDPKVGKEERRGLVEEYLALFNLQGLGKRYPARLSGGQQQRVALARMLAARPQILMLDEPFSALDANLKGALQQSLLDLFGLFEGTILYVSHDIDEAFRFCDRIAVVEEGHVAELAPAGALLAEPATLAAMKITGCENISRARKAGAHAVEALDWKMTFDLGPGRSVPDDLRYVGIRAFRIHEAPEGQTGSNVFSLHVHGVSDTRFERAAMLDTPSGDSGARIRWSVDKRTCPHERWPEAGQDLHLSFDAAGFCLVEG